MWRLHVGLVAFASIAAAMLGWRRRKGRRPALKLTYLDIPGLGEKIRLTLMIAGLPFEDERIGYEEVARRRATGELPFGQVPVLQIDGRQTFAQSNAILRYIGREAGLYPLGVDQLRCDAVLEALMQLDVALLPQYYRAAMGRSPTTGTPQVPLSPRQQEEVKVQLCDDVIPVSLARLERVLAATEGPWFCGPALTICDVACYVLVQGFADGSYVAGIGSAVLAGCPALREHAARVHALPAVQAWHTAR